MSMWNYILKGTFVLGYTCGKAYLVGFKAARAIVKAVTKV